ncbi:terminase [Sphingomonas sp. ABOLF]|uniref:phage terminase small subunit n=1 Tax=Sphingomonas sp. ABOLF TaxID=1985879 RepID=UPI000F7F63AD|nr:phage terminase small subunit [Sphingomonas sp. ABOLF]RSV17016.1 terminase [Sphingomonas sp. ABOLF]GLK21718.1 bacteriophage terminase endonuclease subunit [Microbacterium terregens]
MSLARRHQARILAAQAATLPHGGGTATAGSPAVAHPSVDRAASAAAAQIAMRLAHDLRRLKAIKAISLKIAAKREMLPEYAPWVEGLLTGAAQAGAGASGDVLPTIMIWKIDVGDYAGALPLAEHVLRHNVALPQRYERDAATLVTELIAEAAIKAQTAGEPFDLTVLERVEAMIDGIDMHDQVRAKLMKAIGSELDRTASNPANAPAYTLATLQRSRAALMEAQSLHDRIGVKSILRGVEKRLAAAQPQPAGTSG